MGLLDGRRAVVTGGGSGIGRAVCRRFAAEGRRGGRARHRRRRGPGDGRGGRRRGLRRGRHRRRGPAPGAWTTPPTALGGVSILVNNAGGSTMAPLAGWDPDEWDRIVRLNLTGVFNGMRAGVPHLLAGGGGAVVNTASISATRPVGGRDAVLGGQGRGHRPHGVGRPRVRARHPGQRRGAGDDPHQPDAAAARAPPRRRRRTTSA